MELTLHGNIVDIHSGKIFEGTVNIRDGIIISIIEKEPSINNTLSYILPGFIDAHVHIESSMLIPSEFARLAVVHGTVGTVSDPHEIANVCGMEGVNFMIDNGRQVNFKFYFGAPSCVPATSFETAGATLGTEEIRTLMQRPEIRYLSEMMNFPGVISNDPGVHEKISIAHNAGKPVDGHAPGLSNEPLKQYVSAGISTDHECFTAQEALEKIGLGMKILIREGSAAKNFEALIGLLNEYPGKIMFCSDDKHPDSLLRSHINELCARAVAKGIPVFNVLRAACLNPVLHYRLDVGTLRVNDPADLILTKDLINFEVLSTYINGIKVAENNRSLIESIQPVPVNNFSATTIDANALKSQQDEFMIDGLLPVIEALDGQLITNKLMVDPTKADSDILKLVVINRYHPAPPAISFIKNFGFKNGAIASSVAHDSHNIIAVGADDESLCKAINLIIEARGGISCVAVDQSRVLPLPVAGLMSVEKGESVAAAYTEIDARAKSLGSTLSAPFMTLSFMALLVIPSLKLSDKGLFDGEAFRFIYDQVPD